MVDTMRWRKSPFTRETLHEIRVARGELRASHYNIALDFQGTMKSGVLAAVSAARRVGFARPRETGAAVFYTRRIEAQGKHVVTQNLSLVGALSGEEPRAGLDLPSSGLAKFDLPHDESAERSCQAELSRLELGEFALLSPGAGWGAKQWPAERFGEVARALGQRGLRSLVNAGPGEEGMAREVVARSGGAALVLSSSLPQLVAFTRRARLFVGGDTGPMHLAAALRVPVIALFGPTDPERNGPFGSRHVVLRSRLSAISYSHRRRRDAGLESISSAEVIAAADSLLARAPGVWQ